MEAEILPHPRHDATDGNAKAHERVRGTGFTKTIGSISDDAFDFIKLLEKMQAAEHIRLIEHRGWIK